MPLARLADDDGAHQRHVIEPVDAGEFERDLVVRVELSPPALDAAEEGVLARADDEGIAGIVAAAGKDRALHRGEDFAFVGAGADQLQRGVERVVGERGGAADIGELGRALHARGAPGPDRRRPRASPKVFSASSSARPFAAVRPCVSYSTPMRAPSRPRSFRRSRSCTAGAGARRVRPDDDVLDQRRVARLAQVGGARQQRERAVAREDQALEEAVAERVVAGQPVMALRREEEQRVELSPRHLLQHQRAPRFEFLPARNAAPRSALGRARWRRGGGRNPARRDAWRGGRSKKRASSE